MPDIADITDTARDAVYTLVGFAVLGVQKAQVRRREVGRRLEEPLGAAEARLTRAGSELGRLVKDLDAHFQPVAEQLDRGLDQVEAVLPGPARDALHRARQQADQARSALLSRLP